jgi:hypothetical protein
VSLEREEDAYAEVLSIMFENETLITHMKSANMLVGAAPNQVPIANAIDLAVGSRGMLNIEGWWFLVFRTCNAEGAKLIVEYFSEIWMVKPTAADPSVMEAWPPGKKKAYWDTVTDKDVLRTKFQEWMQTKANWWETSYARIAVNGIGPWPKGDTEG